MGKKKHWLLVAFETGTEQTAASPLGTVVGLTIGLPVLAGYALKDALRDSNRADLKETKRLYDDVATAFSTSPLARHDPVDIAQMIVEDAIEQAGVLPSHEFLTLLLEVVEAEMIELGLFPVGEVEWSELTTLEARVGLRNYLRRQKYFLEHASTHMRLWTETLVKVLVLILEAVPHGIMHVPRGSENVRSRTRVEVPLVNVINDPIMLVERVVVTFFGKELEQKKLFDRTRERMHTNALKASGIDPNDRYRTNKTILFPTDTKGLTPEEVAERYVGGTVFEWLFRFRLPFAVPLETRFEHTHILGGTGHGKTQLLQSLILDDLEAVRDGNQSVVVIDSQGDLIKNILQLALFKPSEPGSLADRLLLVDPNDIAHPVALNMFDVNMERLNTYGAVEREKILRATIELYEHLFGSLLGAELTQKQGVIFGFLAELMLVIPHATIHTLMELMEEGERFHPYIEKLDHTARRFFETQFFDKRFDDTKKQVLQRLWAVLKNRTFDRMFSQPENKVDLFAAMNRGSVILINTAKGLLQEEGSKIFGRFFIAMIVQAAIQREVVAKEGRTPTFVYIDEAHEYFDEKIENMLNQARKYKIGVVAAHQNLGQLTQSIRATVMASTSVKLAGGVSDFDATALAKEMRCTPEFIRSMQKREYDTEFACWVKNKTPQPLRLRVPFLRLERSPQLDRYELETLLARNRARCTSPLQVQDATEERSAEAPSPPRQDVTEKKDDAKPAFELGEPEEL